jgi:hydroxyacylglutathione hydrolase
VESAVQISRIINEPISSNCYILHIKGLSECIIVDPGTSDTSVIQNFLKQHELHADYIILTHEHFDHIWGVNNLKEIYDCQIVCSATCALHIIDKKKNLSLFYDQLGFECYQADLILEKVNYIITWNNIKLRFIQTPGHSTGSICLVIDCFLFSGDTIIYDEKTVTKLPNSSRIELINTIERLSNFIEYPCVVLPGHGEKFTIESREYLLEMEL